MAKEEAALRAREKALDLRELRLDEREELMTKRLGGIESIVDGMLDIAPRPPPRSEEMSWKERAMLNYNKDAERPGRKGVERPRTAPPRRPVEKTKKEEAKQASLLRCRGKQKAVQLKPMFL